MDKRLLVLFLMVSVMISGCSQEKKSSTAPQETKPLANTNSFGIPDGPLSAQVGDYVLAPPGHLVYGTPQKKKYLTFTRRKVSKVGSKESHLLKADREEKIPNVLIIPLGSTQGAQLGDIVLTSNHMDKHLLTRGIVTEGGTEKEPNVHYLEVRQLSRLDNRKFKLQPGSFRVLKSPGEPGSELLCKNKEEFSGVTLIHPTETLYLTKNQLGRMAVYQKSDCEPIPLKPDVQVGDQVLVPIGSIYREGIVKQIEEKFGRLYVEYSFGKLIKERTFPFGVVAISKPGSN